MSKDKNKSSITAVLIYYTQISPEGQQAPN